MCISDEEIAELQKRRQEILHGPQQTEPDQEPIFEPEDVGCQCTDVGIDSEWDWDPDQSVFRCGGCGDVQ